MQPDQVKLLESIAAAASEWRRELHRHPQTKYQETFASAFVCRKLDEWGIPYEQGIAETGIVATIQGRQNNRGRIIAFRTDMDALDITEQSGQPWSSETPGKMHGCGHDGHTATLLTLARYLQLTRMFDGQVRLIFQPAEEEGCGPFRMLKEGLLERFPFDEVYGYHNWPGLSRGIMALRSGPMLAAVESFEVKLAGKGGHAAFPHFTCDVIPAMAQLILSLQTLVSRETDPLASAVISVTNVAAGAGPDNVITGTARLSGTVRTFSSSVRDHLQERIPSVAQGIAAAHNAHSECKYERLMDAVVNHEESTKFCIAAASAVVGVSSVQELQPMMGGEDFWRFSSGSPGRFHRSRTGRAGRFQSP